MVNFNLKGAKLRRRKAISSIVGGAIFLILFAGAVSTFFIAMDFQKDSVNTQRAVSESLMEKTKEKFFIAAATDPNDSDRLSVHVKNQGTNPVEIRNVWVVTKSGSFPADKYDIDYRDSIISPGYGVDVFKNNPIYLTPDDYEIKVVSVLGTIEKTGLEVGGNNYLLAEMFTIPPDVRLNENVTIALRITNVGPTLIETITPDLDFNPNGIEPGKETWLNVPEFISDSPVDLHPSESVIFSWHGTLTNSGIVGQKVKFTNSASGTESLTGYSISSNSASDKITVQDDLGGSSGEEVVLKDELFAKPGLFMIVPNTFGDDNEKAIWGVTVANPTDAPMDVSKITISVLFAGANDNQKIFDSSGPGPDCPHTNYAPTPTDFWQCPNLNQLVWQDRTAPYYVQTIPPRSAYTFLVGVEPGSIQAGEGLDSVVIHASVFTSLGAFGETKWTTSMADSEEPLVNTYLYEQFPAVSPFTNPSFITGSRINIPSGSTQTFQIAIAELNLSSEDIEAGTQLIINIPKQFTNVVLNSWTGPNGDFVDNPTVTQFDDESHQIVGTLETDLASGARLISFDATAPSPSCDKMYVMHVLANGITDNGKKIGPVSEIVLQVNPAGACP